MSFGMNEDLYLFPTTNIPVRPLPLWSRTGSEQSHLRLQTDQKIWALHPLDVRWLGISHPTFPLIPSTTYPGSTFFISDKKKKNKSLKTIGFQLKNLQIHTVQFIDSNLYRSIPSYHMPSFLFSAAARVSGVSLLLFKSWLPWDHHKRTFFFKKK